MDGASALSARLIRELGAHSRVLWLVPGGSNIPLSVAVMEQIPDDLSVRLAVYLTDERFGPIGHPDSNLQQLVDAGFEPKNATVVGVLMPAVALEETVTRYNNAVKAAFAAAGVIIGQFGIGGDGHIAGMLPGTPGITSKAMVVGYSTETFTRVTLTAHALQQVSVAYAYAFGDTKLTALTNLKDRDLPLLEQPSQILKQLPESYIYSDQIDSTPEALNQEGEPS
jgi:6-phosphogluconolactonase/glucosamine-6-phosphate isomerase/deaminase